MPTRELMSLLPAFEAVFAEQSLSRAADRLGVSQSAVSQMIARLRQLTSDPLFVSHGRGVRPTPRAEEMISHVRKALAEIDAITDADRQCEIFDLRRTFKVAVCVEFETILAPAFSREVLAQAPLVTLQTCTSRDPSSLVRTGDVDLAIDIAAADHPDVHSQLSLTSPAVVIGNKSRKQLTELNLYEVPHVAVRYGPITRAETSSPELRAGGRSIRHAAIVSSPSTLAATVASRDHIAVVSKLSALQLSRWFPLSIHFPPVPISPYRLHQIWHVTNDRNPAQRWFRGQINASIRGLASELQLQEQV